MFWTNLEILRIIIHLDPAFFLSAPALAWDSMMLDLINEFEMVKFLSNGCGEVD